MLDFSRDQAEGLRQLMTGPKQRIISLITSAGNDDPSSLFVTLANALSRQGKNTLLTLARKDCAQAIEKYQLINQPSIMEKMLEGIDPKIAVNYHAKGPSSIRLFPENDCQDQLDVVFNAKINNYFSTLALNYDLVLIDAELTPKNILPLAVMNLGEIVIQLNDTPASIQNAYSILKKLKEGLGSRSFGILIRASNEKKAQTIFKNIENVAITYLKTPLELIGYITPNTLFSGNAINSNFSDGSRVTLSSSAAIKQLLSSLTNENYQHTILAK